MALEANYKILNQHAATGLPAAAFGLFVLFGLLAVLQNWLGVPVKASSLTATMATVALFGGTMWLWLRKRPATAMNAHPLLLSLAVVLALHHSWQLWVLAEPTQTINHSLALLSCAFFMTSRTWFYPSLLVCLAGWLPVALSEGLFTDEWRYWTAIIVTSLVLAVVAFEAKRRMILRVETLRHEAQQALARAEAETAKNAQLARVLHESQRREALGKLAGGIAHDFNNLLAIIVGNVELLHVESKADSGVSERLRIIDEAANRATSLTKQILVYAGKAPAKTADIDLGRRAASTLALFQSTLKSSVKLAIHEPDEPVSIKADGALIDQVLVNLVQNATDACEPEGGQIDVRVDYVDSAAREFAFLEVADTGRGMDAQTQQQVFDPFFTTKKQSSGLGLSVVKGIAESHHGEIELRSSSAGTSVRFIIPVANKLSLPEIPNVDAGVSKPLPLPVLVVDDDPGVLQIAESFLQAAEYSVLAAESPISALALVKEGQGISAALIDLTMPEMSGFDLAIALCAENPDLPVVIMSGFDRNNALGENTYEDFVFLPKPFRRAQLVDALSQAIVRAEE